MNFSIPTIRKWHIAAAAFVGVLAISAGVFAVGSADVRADGPTPDRNAPRNRPIPGDTLVLLDDNGVVRHGVHNPWGCKIRVDNPHESS